MTKHDLEVDPRGLIHEAYRMDLDEKDCRSIFLDWVLGAGTGTQTGQSDAERIRVLLAHYANDYPGHPMTTVLREGLGRIDTPPGRRGGRRGRFPEPVDRDDHS